MCERDQGVGRYHDDAGVSGGAAGLTGVIENGEVEGAGNGDCPVGQFLFEVAVPEVDGTGRRRG